MSDSKIPKFITSKNDWDNASTEEVVRTLVEQIRRLRIELQDPMVKIKYGTLQLGRFELIISCLVKLGVPNEYFGEFQDFSLEWIAHGAIESLIAFDKNLTHDWADAEKEVVLEKSIGDLSAGSKTTIGIPSYWLKYMHDARSNESNSRV